MDAADWLALGRHRFRRGARADGWRALRNAAGFREGDAAATAGLWISRRLVGRGSVGAADRLLERLEERFDSDVRVAVALARLLEWRRREPRLALSVVEAAQRRMPETAAELEPRRERLQRKALRQRDLDRGRGRGLRRGGQGEGGQGWFEGTVTN
jgi:hypothetical protein